MEAAFFGEGERLFFGFGECGFSRLSRFRFIFLILAHRSSNRRVLSLHLRGVTHALICVVCELKEIICVIIAVLPARWHAWLVGCESTMTAACRLIDPPARWERSSTAGRRQKPPAGWGMLSTACRRKPPAWWDIAGHLRGEAVTPVWWGHLRLVFTGRWGDCIYIYIYLVSVTCFDI